MRLTGLNPTINKHDKIQSAYMITSKFADDMGTQGVNGQSVGKMKELQFLLVWKSWICRGTRKQYAFT